MKVSCPLSGLTYEVSFPHWGTSTAPHPMLSMSAASLTSSFLELHSAQQLSSELTHLLALGYLTKLPLVSFEPFTSKAHETMHSFWLENMERLARIANRLEDKKFHRTLPTIRISQDNLRNLKHWIEDIEGVLAGLSISIDSDKVRKINSASFKAELADKLDSSKSIEFYSADEIQELILRGLKGSILTKKEAKAFPTLMADWTRTVAEFPSTKLTLPSGKRTTISSYWHTLVEAAFSKTGLLELLTEDVNIADIEELIEHCYEHVSYDYSVHASSLWAKLEELRNSVQSYKDNPTGKVRAPKVPTFKGSTADLLALLGETPVETMAPQGPEDSTVSILLGDSPATTTSAPHPSGLTLQQRLALKLAKK